jgi:hypothetical protein
MFKGKEMEMIKNDSSHIKIYSLVLISSLIPLLLCVLRKILEISLEDYLIELFLIEFFGIFAMLVYLLFNYQLKTPPKGKVKAHLNN